MSERDPEFLAGHGQAPVTSATEIFGQQQGADERNGWRLQSGVQALLVQHADVERGMMGGDEPNPVKQAGGLVPDLPEPRGILGSRRADSVQACETKAALRRADEALEAIDDLAVDDADYTESAGTDRPAVGGFEVDCGEGGRPHSSQSMARRGGA